LLLDALYASSSKIAPRAQDTREILGVQLRVEDLRSNILVCANRNLNYRYLVAEWIWILLGMDEVAPLVRYNSKMAEFSDDGETLSGAYGPRIFGEPEATSTDDDVDYYGFLWPNQFAWVLAKLRQDAVSRQAVIQIWWPCPGPSKDIACTLSMQFLIRNGALHCIVTMRSSDVWLGLPYDFFTFSQLANVMASELGVQTGSMIMNLGSSHLYERDVPGAEAVFVAESMSIRAHTLRSPALGLFPTNISYDRLKRALCTSETWKSGVSYYEPYIKILCSATKAEALEVLRELSSKS
jgi:thymidylate synthase